MKKHFDFNIRKPNIPDPSDIIDWAKNHKKIAIGGGIGVVAIIAAIVGILSYIKKVERQKALEAAVIDYSLQALTIDQLEGGNYYIKDGDVF